MKLEWEGPGDPLYLPPPQREPWSRQLMFDFKDAPVSKLLTEAAARWPRPFLDVDLDWI
jgi:hypothetical protein